MDGVLIPAQAVIMPQPGAVVLDEAEFAEPDQFRPERFLDEAGQYRPHPALTPFGLGRRACLGEGLARTELYLVLGSLVQDLEFRADPKMGLPSLRRRRGMTSVPLATSYVVVRRFPKLLHREHE